MTQKKFANQRSILWLTFATLLIGVVFSLTHLPKTYNKDLSIIGHGKHVAVVVHNEKDRASRRFIHLVDKAREVYNEEEIEFCVAFIRTPEGEAFSKEHDADKTSLVLFSQDGHRVKTIHELRDSNQLIDEIDMAFNFQSHTPHTLHSTL